MPEYVIHACPQREWYVNDYLIPSMLEQGIPRENIEVWLDDTHMGNLISCMKCFEHYGTKGGGRWHLQDDVCISSDFAEKTAQYDDGIVCGFFRHDWQCMQARHGSVPAVFMWNSFQCVRIPDELAGECAEWFFLDAAWRDTYKEQVQENKYDDSMFYDFIIEKHLELRVQNLKPSIVDHIDFLLGGSIVNEWRGYIARGEYWEDTEAFNRMKDKLAHR